MTPLQFHQVMMMLSCRFPFRVTSYYRDPLSNALPSIGGVVNSRHMLWLAMDIILYHATDIQGFENEAKRQGLLVIPEPDHLHVQA
jgi:uncharacterized protein YcbK (DUF882 family)